MFSYVDQFDTVNLEKMNKSGVFFHSTSRLKCINTMESLEKVMLNKVKPERKCTV